MEAEEGTSWIGAVDTLVPDLLQQRIRRDVKLGANDVGWHAILSPHASDEDARKWLVGARTQNVEQLDADAMFIAQHTTKGKLPEQAIRSLMERLLSIDNGQYENRKLDDTELEALLGMKEGKVHFFLASGALENIRNVVLNKKFLKEAEPDELIVFTMHDRFFFVCSVADLQSWLKTNEARFSMDNKLRVESHQYPAIASDFEGLGESAAMDLLHQPLGRLAKRAKAGDIPADSIGSAVRGNVNRALRAADPGLNWGTEPVMDAIRAKDALRRLIEAIRVPD